MFEGTWTALVTPFRDDSLDERALREAVDRQIDGGVTGLVPCGTTGESVALVDDEPARVIRIVVEQAKGRVPVVAGASTASTSKSIALAELAREQGADGLLLVCPYYNRPTQGGLEAHFRAILGAVPLPAVLYNIPGRTGVDLSIETIERLADLEQIVAVKEATGNVVRAQEIVARFGDRFTVLSGDDALTLPMMAVGAKGVISVASNVVPRRIVEIVDDGLAGRFAAARDKHLALLALYAALFAESNPGPIKMAMALSGWIAEEIRLPLVWPSAVTEDRLKGLLKSLA